MKTRLAIALIAFSTALNAQWINSLSIQAEGGLQYDTYNPGKDRNIIDVPVKDMQSWNSEIDGLNPNGALYVNYTLTPLFSWTVGGFAGTISGSNTSDYYQASLKGLDMGVRFHSSNLNPATFDSKWKFTPMAMISFNQYTSELFFLSDNSLQNIEDNNAWGSAFGAELAYNLNNNWTLYGSGQYRTVYSDGLDGWDYGSGSDSYVRATVGVKYRFTVKRDEEIVLNKSDFNFYGPEVMSMAPAMSEIAKDNSEEMKTIVSELKSEVEKQVAASTEKSEKDLARIEEALTMLRASDNALFEASHKTAVFFASESSKLSLDTKQELFRFVQTLKADDWDGQFKVVIRAYTDMYGNADYNQDLRDKRAASVKTFVEEELGMAVPVVIFTPEHDKLDEHRLDRRVELSVEVTE